MGAQDEIGVDTAGAQATGAATVTLSERYADLTGDFRGELGLLGQASMNEMAVVSGVQEYCSGVVGQLAGLQAHTQALGAAVQTAAVVAHRVDTGVASSIGSVLTR